MRNDVLSLILDLEQKGISARAILVVVKEWLVQGNPVLPEGPLFRATVSNDDPWENPTVNTRHGSREPELMARGKHATREEMINTAIGVYDTLSEAEEKGCTLWVEGCDGMQYNRTLAVGAPGKKKLWKGTPEEKHLHCNECDTTEPDEWIVPYLETPFPESCFPRKNRLQGAWCLPCFDRLGMSAVYKDLRTIWIEYAQILTTELNTAQATSHHRCSDETVIRGCELREVLGIDVVRGMIFSNTGGWTPEEAKALEEAAEGAEIVDGELVAVEREAGIALTGSTDKAQAQPTEAKTQPTEAAWSPSRDDGVQSPPTSPENNESPPAASQSAEPILSREFMDGIVRPYMKVAVPQTPITIARGDIEIKANDVSTMTHLGEDAHLYAFTAMWKTGRAPAGTQGCPAESWCSESGAIERLKKATEQESHIELQWASLKYDPERGG